MLQFRSLLVSIVVAAIVWLPIHDACGHGMANNATHSSSDLDTRRTTDIDDLLDRFSIGLVPLLLCAVSAPVVGSVQSAADMAMLNLM